MVIKNTTGAFIELFDIMSPNTEEVSGGLFTYYIKGIDAGGTIDLSDYNAPSAEFNSREIEEQISAGNIIVVHEGTDLNLSDSLEYFKTFGVSEAVKDSEFKSSDITGKTQITPTSGDFLILTDGSDSDNLKKVDAADFLSGSGAPVVILPASIGSNQNDYNPTGFVGADIVILTISTDVDITGFQAATAYGRKLLINSSISNKIKIKENDSSSAAGNRVTCPDNKDYEIKKGGAVEIIYNASAATWQIIGEKS